MKHKPIVFSLFESNHLANEICSTLQYTRGTVDIHHFPDKEIKISLTSPVKDNTVIFVASTDKPNDKMAALFFAAATAKDLGAKKVGLIAPYLAYMRQDKQFHPGEGITSKYFAQMISAHFDWLITIDPHLHRWHALNEIFTISTQLLHATADIAQWIQKNISNPVLIGPDKESQQWVAEIAQIAQAPFLTAEKQRFGDASVTSTIPQIENYKNHAPVVIDDIISTGMTMIATINHLKSLNMQPIHCIGVHAIFANNAYEKLTALAKVITCNTIAHPSNKIDISAIITKALL
jgi:ribose-phosphate pyrophosphokinase